MTFSTKMFAFLFALTLAFGQGKKPLTAEGLIQMKKAGFDEQTMIKAIEANGATVDTSAQGLMSLKDAGLGDAVIRATLLASNPERASLPSASTPTSSLIPEEVGVYLADSGKIKPLPAEVVKFGSTSPFRMMATAGFGATRIKGKVAGAKSPVQLSGPIVLVLRCPEGVSPDAYQLLILDTKKNSREFTTGKMSMFGGMSSTLTR
jgi:hypothetical protein